MSIKTKMKIVRRPAAILCIISGAALGLLPVSSAFSSVAGTANPGETCEYSLQLQNSAAVRSQYIARVIEVSGGAIAGSPVEAMYASVEKASYTTTSPASGASADLWGLGLTKKSSATADSLSMDCLGCHDGATASAIHVDLRNDPFAGSRVKSFKSDHPIGMFYSSYVAAGRGYKTIAPGSNRMIFVNGKVGCLTCHDPLNPDKGHLVMSDRQSALCLTCHNK